MRIKNYFIATLIGLIPGVFIFVSIGSGIDKFLIKDSLDWSGLIEGSRNIFPNLRFCFNFYCWNFYKKKIF
jgi:uncharacterized membrane protein YdjX (TVP38/TMEM64 family)